MVERYPRRFNDQYWSVFRANVGRHLPPEPAIADLGCGPGFYLRDLSERHQDSRLYGFDASRGHDRPRPRVALPGAPPILVAQDVEKEPLPLAAGSVDMVSMTGVLHVLDDAFAVLSEVQRVLRPGGLFLLDDWVRMPWRSTSRTGSAPAASRGTASVPAGSACSRSTTSTPPRTGSGCWPKPGSRWSRR